MTASTRQRFDDMDPAQQAGILCNDPRFQQFAAIRCGFPGGQFSSEAAAEYVRDICKINSRRQLTQNPDAETRFQAMRTDFDAWTGKIATPR
ncbi:hypothetical protein [Donghicola eburneus]|uniref:hypothetical protein n=1 Tax=Donghicola eburneus TaxID=393278 RepID=UPI0008EBEC82|nr:hypothetical protein [Donghicola eburneus]SFQ52125.1 hypothetical protein SAMN05421764_10597 [Donghicola eburneus]